MATIAAAVQRSGGSLAKPAEQLDDELDDLVASLELAASASSTGLGAPVPFSAPSSACHVCAPGGPRAGPLGAPSKRSEARSRTMPAGLHRVGRACQVPLLQVLRAYTRICPE